MTDAELMAVLNERDRLRAEVEEVRRLLLPHPDAKAGEDAGCACDLHTAVTAAGWAAGEMRRLEAEVRRLRAEVAEQKRANVQLAERLASCSEVLGQAAGRGKVCQCSVPEVSA